jgi:hypothetical protein
LPHPSAVVMGIEPAIIQVPKNTAGSARWRSPLDWTGQRRTQAFLSISAACAAARRAIGTRNGEHDT